MEAINTRRSIRTYTDQEIESDKIEKLLRAGMQAPSSGNQQSWEFLVIQDKESLDILSLMSPYSRLAAKASLVIIPLNNDDRLKFAENWQQDLSAATENILLEAVALGLGTVWLGVAPNEEKIGYIANCFELPANLKPFALIAIGYPAKGSENKFVDRYDKTRVHYEKY
ncbi:nitroreductase [Sphaerochaeta pleomorpha str. Grapes]|uniref:Nitroreductase n=1 Tax=Sphaerochaeta pleomorpha (strain ATCC BAA-1885 / DSM 22778 / Grapes) TaxID=158190 RepID=G8QX06_SPHPG|nr:nitroreductase family protein [Sphaerochaeta pleomorpha]AEV29510.1 nitroreductase [Sphaerochaeta pleomorpha str. Grapes]